MKNWDSFTINHCCSTYSCDKRKFSPSAKVPDILSSIYAPSKPSNIDAVTVVEIIAPVNITTRAPTNKEKTIFQPVTTTVFPSANYPASLSSIYVPRKWSPVTTDYIHTIVDISGIDFNKTMYGGGNKTKVLENKCLDLDRVCHKYFLVTGK